MKHLIWIDLPIRAVKRYAVKADSVTEAMELLAEGKAPYVGVFDVEVTGEAMEYDGHTSFGVRAKNNDKD